MEENEKSRNKMYTTVGIAALILIAGGVLYYFRNYSIKTDQAATPAKVEETNEAETPPVPEVPVDTEAAKSPTTVWEVIAPITQNSHILGSPNAKLTIILYSDIECPFCKKFHATMQQVMDEYGKNGTVRWVYRHFPLKELHPTAPKEAEATECAAELGGNEKFWQYLDKLVVNFTPSETNLTNQLSDVAQEIGLNRDQFKTCLESGKYAAGLEATSQEAIMLGAGGTPYSIIVNSEGKIAPIPGALPYEDLKSTIDLML